ncbi:MAG: polyribonucleotide nucleotidyltransferase, partial [Actinomycetia bacterium]|nr:polyribonucleotide nucleotidyltransferase [Actinomycetes bacterium]
MLEIFKKEINVDGKVIFLESGKIAKQADGAVLIGCGETLVLVTAVGSKEEKDLDFFPLTVDIEERMYAAGKIPGGFFKREGRPSEKAILTARLIDRPLRPSFPKGYR